MYPVNFKIKNEKCLIIGGGHVAVRKMRLLLEEHAMITIMAPEADERILKEAAQGTVTFIKRSFQPGDEKGCHLVITACGVPSIAKYLHEASRKSFFLLNAADFPEKGNCSLPSRFTRGSLMVTVSTGGRSPEFSRFIRAYLEKQIPPEFGLWLNRVAALREELKTKMDTSEQRESFWRCAFSDTMIQLVLQGNFDEAEEQLRHETGSIRP